MENGPFIEDFPIKTSIYKGFSMAMLNNQRVYAKNTKDLCWSMSWWGGPWEVHAAAVENRREDLGAQEVRGLSQKTFDILQE